MISNPTGRLAEYFIIIYNKRVCHKTMTHPHLFIGYYSAV